VLTFNFVGDIGPGISRFGRVPLKLERLFVHEISALVNDGFGPVNPCFLIDLGLGRRFSPEYENPSKQAAPMCVGHDPNFNSRISNLEPSGVRTRGDRA
jgi:hypothetical protein